MARGTGSKKGKGKAKGRKRSRRGGDGSAFAHLRTNSSERRDGTRKEGRCQLCLNKVPLTDQYTAVNNLDEGTVTKSKKGAAAKESNAHLSHYCGDCVDKRVKRKEYWMENVREADGPDQRGQGGGRKKKKATKKATPRKRTRKAKGKRKRTRTKAEPKAKSTPKPKKRKRTKAKAQAAAASDEPF